MEPKVDPKSPETKITAVEKVKDPRRVKQGKKLAAISREAKERKARERAERQREAESKSELLSPYLVIVPVIGLTIYGGYHYYYRYDNKGEEPSQEAPKALKLERL